MSDNALRRMLSLFGKYGHEGSLLWTANLDFAIVCNDVFVPAADAEAVKNDADVELIEKCVWDLENALPGAGEYFPLLYCLRKVRKPPRLRLNHYRPEIRHFFQEFDPSP